MLKRHIVWASFDLSITRQTFIQFATIELQYRHRQSNDIHSVLDDIFQTALCICLRGSQNPEEFKLLQDGISRIGNFIHSERYTLDSAIINASKVAYLCNLIENGINKVNHYSPEKINELASAVLHQPLPTKLNKLKKTHPEAFFYWYEIQKNNNNKN